MKIVTYYTDPGHGWFAVKLAELEALGIDRAISTYSYKRGKTAYLEEDCDASLYFAALRKAGTEWRYTEKHTDRRHQIRSYSHY
jgi:hypothetical protein